MDNGQPFPHRDMILFVTFGVIIATLVGQGLLLPSVVHWLGLSGLGKKEHAEEIKREVDAAQGGPGGGDPSGSTRHSPTTSCRLMSPSICARATRAGFR